MRGTPWTVLRVPPEVELMILRIATNGEYRGTLGTAWCIILLWIWWQRWIETYAIIEFIFNVEGEVLCADLESVIHSTGLVIWNLVKDPKCVKQVFVNSTGEEGCWDAYLGEPRPRDNSYDYLAEVEATEQLEAAWRLTSNRCTDSRATNFKVGSGR